MKPERITHLSAPPVVGRRYLVPTVSHPWLNDARQAWPVFLPVHDDARFFNFPDTHYHVDPRFLDKRSWAAIGGGEDPFWTNIVGAQDQGYLKCQGHPIARRRRAPGDFDPPRPVWKVRYCHRSEAPYQAGTSVSVQALNDHYAGNQCKRARIGGWVCPHQGWPMGSIEPDAEGVITCPLHGLRVRASDGVVLGNRVEPKANAA